MRGRGGRGDGGGGGGGGGGWEDSSIHMTTAECCP